MFLPPAVFFDMYTCQQSPPAVSIRLRHCDSVVIWDREAGSATPSYQTAQQLADIPHPAVAHGVLPEADFFPLLVLIEAAAGDRDVNMRMPVESQAVSVERAENADNQRPFAGGVQQVINRQAAEVVKQPAVDLKQGPERIGQGENQVDPVAVRQAVKLSGNPQAGYLFTAGRTGAAVAGIGDVFNMVAVRITAAILLHDGDAGAAGEHFSDGFNFNIASSTGVKKGGPALVGRKDFF